MDSGLDTSSAAHEFRIHDDLDCGQCREAVLDFRMLEDPTPRQVTKGASVVLTVSKTNKRGRRARIPRGLPLINLRRRSGSAPRVRGPAASAPRAAGGRGPPPTLPDKN
ncbi:hypothetical protein EVAR_15852_1 [Eumeta japonica]|uniref:Uncharacterized protein n=1 Tax=Eumeta variegata TaxID=151549 RepID=A0A4C1UFB8_EUMVA|nr:hypothetical protein EVAR_15852_1 [Eumeta japonica]